MKAVGLDIGLHSLKVVVIEGSPKRPKVLRFVEHRLAEGSTTRVLEPGALGGLLDKLFEKHKLPRENVVIAAPAANCLIRELQVPFTRDDQIQKTLKFQAESAFHSVQIDDMVVDHYKVEEHDQRTRLIVVALRKDVLERQLDALAVADIDPVAVDLDIAAIFNAFVRAHGERGAERPTVLVDLGAGALKVAVVAGGRIRAIRSLRANASAVKVEEAGAQQKRPTSLEDLKAGLLTEEREDTFFADDEGRLPVVILDEEQSQLFDFEAEESRQSVLEKVFFEIDRTLARTFLMDPIERIVLTGGGSRAPGIVEAFAEHFQCECERLELKGVTLGKLGKDERAALEHTGATAVGLALKGLGVDFGGFDLRREEFVFAGTFDRLKGSLAETLVLLFVLFFLVAYRYQVVETDRLALKQQRLRTYQASIFENVFSESPKAGSVLINLRQRERQLKQKLGLAVPDVVSALDVLRDFSRAVKDAGKEIELKTATLRDRQRSIVIVVKQRTDVYDIKQRLDEGDYLVAVEREQIDSDPKTQELRATLTLKLKADDKKKSGLLGGAGG